MKDKNQDHLNLECLFPPTPAFIFAPNPWFKFHFQYFVQHFGSTMSNHSFNYSVTSPHPNSPAGPTSKYHPSAIILNENAPMSPNTVLSTLAAHDQVPTETLQEIITGLIVTIKLCEVAWETNCTAMRACINHAKDHLETAIDTHEALDFDFNKTSVPTDFIHNNNRIPTFQIPIGEELHLPAKFIKRDEDNHKKVWGVTGCFGKQEPVYAHKLFTHPVQDAGTTAEPLWPWFLRLLQGSTASYTHLHNTTDELGDWGLATNVAQYHEFEDQIHKLNATIHSLHAEAKLTKVLQDGCHYCLTTANAHSHLAHLESACHGKDCCFPVRGDFAICPTSY